MNAPAIDISFVVIGFNESPILADCIASCRRAAPRGLQTEILYADGGSTDGSISIAQQAGADRILGGDKRRRAAENRNLGLHAAQGCYVQFVDGDMLLEPDWPAAAVAALEARPETAIVCGALHERGAGLLSRVLELDWI